jgi:hypothetical protein
MAFYDDYLKLLKSSPQHLKENPCKAVKDLDGFLDQCSKCKKQADAFALLKKVDGSFDKAQAELAKCLEPLVKSPWMPKDHPAIVKLKDIKADIEARRKPTEKKLDDMLAKLP